MQYLLSFVLLAFSAFFTSADARVAGNPYLNRRGTTDVCGNVNAPLRVVVPPNTITLGQINACVCLSGIPAFLAANSVALAAVQLVGASSATAALSALVRNAADQATCVYPSGATPQCQGSNACGFTCTNGFTPFPPGRPDSCRCQPPRVTCNGVCGNFQNCPTQQPARRELDEDFAYCKEGQTVCGIWGTTSSLTRKAWECVDTQNDAESCGGCMVEFGKTRATGIDCTALPGVADVSCSRGQCAVHSCAPGYQLTQDGLSCVHENKEILQAEIEAALAFAGFKRDSD